MKRVFTLLALVSLVVSGVSAQNLRKTWDFREGFSQKTVNALKADQEEFGDTKYWRNYESDATKADEQHFWNASGDFKNDKGYACTHSGGKETVIPELEGLSLGAKAAKKFVITYNGATKDGYEGSPNGKHPYGPSYIWLNGKSETFSFQAKCGQKIRIGVESHSNSQDRGISLSTDNGSLELVEGNPVPTFYTDCAWELNGDEESVATLTVKTTNGCHIYYIIVGEGDAPAEKDKVAYLYSGDLAADNAFAALKANEEIDVVPFDVTGDVSSVNTVEGLRAFTATVISSSVPADNAIVPVLKDIIPFVPVLNLNPALYGVWGFGEAVPTNDIFGNILDKKNSLFENAEVVEEEDVAGIVFTNGVGITGLKLAGRFANDAIIATTMSDPEIVAIHAHNIYHNGYIYLPYTVEAAADAYPSSLVLLNNAINMLKDSKSDITAVGAPRITVEYKDKNTNVTIEALPSSLPDAQIFYTIDGTDPTLESTKYEGVLNFTEPVTVKAVAIAEGYTLSEVATKEVEIKEQPKTPAISFEAQEGMSVVTITGETEGADLWYNFSEVVDTTKSMKYTEPFILKENKTVTAFAVAGGAVFSEPVSQRVVIKNAVVRIDQVAHFDANKEAWNAKGEEAQSSSTTYYFSWGKSAASIYDETAEPTIDENDSIIYPERDYEFQLPIAESGQGWQIRSKGQVMIYQVLSVGKDPGNAEGYNPATSADVSDLITANDIQFGGKTSGQPCTGAIESTITFQAPFDILTFIGTASGNEAKLAIQVSTDGNTWTQTDDTIVVANEKRLWSKYVRSYEGNDQVYVRLTQVGGSTGAQCYDIYVMTAGEKSAELKKQMDEEFESVMGIENVVVREVKKTGIYNLNGQRLSAPVKGVNIIDGRKVIIR